MQVGEVALAMDIPWLSRGHLEQAGDLGQLAGRMSCCVACPYWNSPFAFTVASPSRPIRIAGGDIDPGHLANARQPGTALTSRTTSWPRSQVDDQVHAGHLGPHGQGGGQCQSFGLGIELGRLGTTAERHVGTPVAVGRMRRIEPRTEPLQDEDPEIVAGMAHSPLKIEHARPAVRAREMSARPAPCR